MAKREDGSDATVTAVGTRSPAGPTAGPTDPRHTGRHLVLLRDGTGRAGVELLRNAAGLRMAVSSDFEGIVRKAHLVAGEGMLFERIGVALLHGDPDRARALVNRAEPNSIAVEPERFVRATGQGDESGSPAARTPGVGHPSPAAPGSARGSGKQLSAQSVANDGRPGPTPLSMPVADTAEATWGLQALRVLSSRFSGLGIRVAVLDTGLDLQHPDFAGRNIVAQSFVTGAAVDDGLGHGTHCAGVVCGPAHPSQPPRYGVAPNARLYVGKVVGDDGSGTDGNVLAGIDWAVRNSCAVICMSLGTPVVQGEPYSHIYEQVAARALAAGTVLVAAAGNESERPDAVVPVNHPADCPSILAVGAIDPHFGIAPFSNGGLSPDGGEVDIAAPGVAIVSSWPRPALYRAASGTSMAAPLVTGILALLAEANPAARGTALQALLLNTALALSLPARDVGAGLAQAPQ